jgi:hypothetical protein
VTSLVTHPRQTQQDSGLERPKPAFWLRVSEPSAVTAGFLLLYAVVGAILVFRYDAIMEDALSRVSNAEYVLYSRQPKLAAVGFVWTPLPSYDFLPFLWLKGLMPDLVRLGYLANVQSAAAMALAVRFLLRILTELGLGRRNRLVLTILFGLNPLILFFGANGMTEAMLLALLLFATSRLMLWLTNPRPQYLVAAGLALALGYLARYEVAAVGLAATVLVGGVSWLRARGTPAARSTVAFADSVLVASPVAMTFVLWATASWIIVGHPFDQFTSVYGNSALIDNARAAHPATAGAGSVTFMPKQWLLLAPLLIPVLIAVAVRSVRRKDPRPLAPVFLLGSVLLFEAAVYMSGGLFGFLRYSISILPLYVILAGLLCVPNMAGKGERSKKQAAMKDSGLQSRWLRTRYRYRLGRLPARTGSFAAALLVFSLIATSWAVMAQPELASQEHDYLRPIVMSMTRHRVPSAVIGMWRSDRAVAAYLDRMHLTPGAVLVDSGPGFAVIAASAHPQQFVITSDTDFIGAARDPVGHHVQYLLVSEQSRQTDQVARTWGSKLGDSKALPWATQVRPFVDLTGSRNNWSLWKVDLSYRMGSAGARATRVAHQAASDAK